MERRPTDYEARKRRREVRKLARMRHYDLSAQSLELIERLKRVPWFAHIGEPAVAKEIRRAVDLRVAKKLCFSRRWDNAITDSGNQLSVFLSKYYRDRYDKKWSEIVHTCIPLLMPIIESAIEHGREKLELGAVQVKVLSMTLRRQFIGACHEIEYADMMQDLLCLQLVPWYELGHWPCGYQGEWPNGMLVVY
jgi:hypothetical protein